MYIYTTEPRFNPKTGKPVKGERAWKETRCDFSGRVVESKTRNGYPAYYCKFKLDYGDQDPCFGASGDEYQFGQECHLNMHRFLSGAYIIFYDCETGETEMPKFLKALAKHSSLDDALRTMRIATARRLLAAGTIQAADLVDE